MRILKDIQELTAAGVLNKETAEKIQEYYRLKYNQTGNRLFVIFGILGALLVGLGIILILAHNWDDLSRPLKTFFAFLPLFAGQLLCAYTLFQRKSNVLWQESSSCFLFFSVGACISLISQIYNIPGNLNSFLLNWMVLCLPLVYLLRSSVVSMLYIVGITWYGCIAENFHSAPLDFYMYWILLLLILPHLYHLYKTKPESNFLLVHNWLISLSVIIQFATIIGQAHEYIAIAYISLFGLLYLLGTTEFFIKQNARHNSYKIIGYTGTLIVLMILSFDYFWKELREKNEFIDDFNSPEFITAVFTSITALALLLFQIPKVQRKESLPIAPVFLLFILTFIIGLWSPVSVILVNLMILSIALYTVVTGVKQDHLGILNVGLFAIMVLVSCRFFDTKLSFVFRGLMFVIAGAGFFVSNYLMIKKRKSNAQE